MPNALGARPHVLITADAVGGVWTYALDLARGLLDTGLKVTLVVLGPLPSGSQMGAAQAVCGLAVTGLNGELDWQADREAVLRPVAAEIALLARRIGADLIHLNSPALAGLASFTLPVVGGCHSCLATWWRSVEGAVLPQEMVWRRDLLAQGYAQCDALIAPSGAFAEATAAEYGVLPVVVPNGRGLSHTASLKQAGLVLTAGRLWDKGKGAATLDRATRILGRRIVALGPLAEPGNAAVWFGALRTPGQQTTLEMAGWLASASVFVSAARYEPFGLAVLEAAQAGAALVLSDIPTFREMWDGAALFVPADDAHGFAAAIGRLLDDDRLAAQARAAASARAARYTVKAMTESTLAQYRRVAPAAFGEAGLEVAA